MTISRGNPISIEVLNVSEEGLEDQINQLITSIRATDRDYIGWLRKQRELIRLRIGHRKPKSLPWKGASNISVPLIDGVIRRYKPGLAALVLDADPVAYFTPQESTDIDPARMVEPMFTYLFREYMDTVNSTVQLTDLIAWRGHAYTREGWDYRTRKDARVVQVAQVFPEGIDVLAQQAAQAQVQGQQITVEEVIAARLAEEYEMSLEDESEQQMLFAAAQEILQGREYIKIVYRRVVSDRPSWMAIDPVNVIAPQNQDPETGEFFTIIHHMTPDQLRSLANDGHLRPGAVDTVLRSSKRTEEGKIFNTDSDTERSRIRDVMDDFAGVGDTISQKETGKIMVWEIYCMLDIDGDGERERCILWHAPQVGDSNSGLSLGLLDFPYPFETWPITYFPFEAAKRPVDNRGIAELLKPHQKVVNAHHNARIDAAQILLAPVMKMRMTGGDYQQNVKWAPGAIIPLTNMNDLEPVVHDLRILTSLLQEEQSEQRLAETYIGVFDATLTNLQQSSERRTAAEVNAIQSISASIFGLDAKIFQTAFSKSLNKVWALYDDLGPDELFFRVTGEQKPRLARKHEISKRYDIRAAGTPANTARAFQLQNLERMMQLILNPIVLQSGKVDISPVIERFLKLIEYNAATDVIRPDEMATAVQTIRQAGEAITGEEQPVF